MNVRRAIYTPVIRRQNAAIFEYALNELSPLFNRAEQQKKMILNNMFKKELPLIETKNSENRIITQYLIEKCLMEVLCTIDDEEYSKIVKFACISVPSTKMLLLKIRKRLEIWIPLVNRKRVSKESSYFKNLVNGIDKLSYLQEIQKKYILY